MKPIRHELHVVKADGRHVVIEMWAESKADAILRVLKDVPWVTPDAITHITTG